MILPVAKLGTLLLKTMSKPIASRLKAEASRHPKFRQLIINLAQVPLLPVHPLRLSLA
jgi:optic atrophy 3 protein